VEHSGAGSPGRHRYRLRTDRRHGCCVCTVMRDPKDIARRRNLAALLWALRRERRRSATLASAALDDMADVRVMLRRATTWRPMPPDPTAH
jgi:hypothetical protein